MKWIKDLFRDDLEQVPGEILTWRLPTGGYRGVEYVYTGEPVYFDKAPKKRKKKKCK